jgi:hypothetical protein
MNVSGVPAGRKAECRTAAIGGLSVDGPERFCHLVPDMGTWPFVTRQCGSALRQQFAVLRFVVISPITLAMSETVTSALRRDLPDREWGTTADYIRTGILHLLTPRDFSQPEDETTQGRFEAFYTQAMGMPEIVRVKAYDANIRAAEKVASLGAHDTG